MISLTEQASGRGLPPSYRLKIELAAVRPRIWRRLLVPGNANLGWLHAVIQVTMGWTNSHLHMFSVSGTDYADTRYVFPELEGDPQAIEESKVTVRELVPHPKDRMTYMYDFGDSWEHEIIVEKLQPTDPAAATIAQCLEGARACPPEDCGSYFGYAELLKALKNRRHPEHKHLKEWVGGAFDPEAFDLSTTNLWLRKLKWPRVTEAHLQKVLMGRALAG